jgi:hypothetical protein
VGVSVDVLVGTGVAVGVSVAVGVNVGVFVEVLVGVAVSVGVLVAVYVGVAVFVGVLVGVFVGVGGVVINPLKITAPLDAKEAITTLPPLTGYALPVRASYNVVPFVM